MNNLDKQYLDICLDIIQGGTHKNDRTGTGTVSAFAKQIRVDLRDGFPILTTKKVHFKSIVVELLWFLRGETNIKFLKENGVKIWDAWATEDGEIGPMYGSQWRNWEGRKFDSARDRFERTDQIGDLVFNLHTNPDSRRHVVNAWNVADLPNEQQSPYINAHVGKMALAPCHYSFQCYVADGRLSMLVNQRSADMFLGVPFNIASYALLTHMIAQVCDLEVGELIWSGGDCHVYADHVEQIWTQIERLIAGEVFALPRLELNPDIKDIDGFTLDDIKLIDYKSGDRIAGSVAV